jgi:hypothetical protein
MSDQEKNGLLQDLVRMSESELLDFLLLISSVITKKRKDAESPSVMKIAPIHE